MAPTAALAPHFVTFQRQMCMGLSMCGELRSLKPFLIYGGIPFVLNTRMPPKMARANFCVVTSLPRVMYKVPSSHEMPNGLMAWNALAAQHKKLTPDDSVTASGALRDRFRRAY